MKKSLLWVALATLMNAHVHADASVQQPAQGALTPPAVQQPNNVQNQPADPTGIAPVQQTSAQPTTPAQKVQPLGGAADVVIDCDYKIPSTDTTVDSSVVLSWAQKATTQAFDFDVANLDAKMSNLQHCFTEQGWMSFNAALQKSGNLDAIKNQKLNVSSQVDGPAQIIEAKDNQWKISLPVQVVYQNDKEKVTQALDIKLSIARKPSGDLGIAQIIATPRVAAANAPAAQSTVVGAPPVTR